MDQGWLPDLGRRLGPPFGVNHGIKCVGFRISRGGSAMTFASDTRPGENVVWYAKGAELLVHEAYGLEGGAEQGHAFGYSTAAEARRAAREAGVSASSLPTCARAATNHPRS